MKKFFTLIAVCAFTSVLSAQKPLVLMAPDVQVEYQISAISPNGMWVCGNVNDGEPRGFRWNLSTNDFMQLSAIGDHSTAMGISNDGTVVGSFYDAEATSNGTQAIAAGYWKDGTWHHLDLGGYVNDIDAGSWAYCISPNGRNIGGIACLDGKFLPVSWTDGRFNVYESQEGAVYAISDDGEIAAGWTLHPTARNRTACLWTPDSLLLNPSEWGPWSVAGSISANKRMVLAGTVLYDIEAQQLTRLPQDIGMGCEFAQVANSGNVVGYYLDSLRQFRGVYYKDGELLDMQTYLEAQGADLSNFTVLQCNGVSADERTFALMVYDTREIPHPLVVKFDAETEFPAPVGLQAVQMPGLSTCKLSWKAPLVRAEAVTGYSIFRDGAHLADVGADTFVYYDAPLAEGSYAYAVVANYGETSSEKIEISTAEIALSAAELPRNAAVVQANCTDVRLFWDAPAPNLPTLSYMEPTDKIFSFGGGENSFEFAVRFDKRDLACYEGYTIQDIQFIPMSEQKSWTVNIYEEGTATPIYSEEVSSAGFVYGVLNAVHLTEAVSVPAGKDVIVSVAVDVTGFGGYDVVGVVFNRKTAGFTDLLRQVGEENFFSLYEQALVSETGAYEYAVTWPLSLSLRNASLKNAATLDHYNVYADGRLLTTTKECRHTLVGEAEGSHEYGVSATYKDGSTSPLATVQFDLRENPAYYAPAEPLLTTEGLQVQAAWEAPVANDRQTVSYALGEYYSAVSSSDNSYMAKTIYSRERLKYLEGYQIDALRFYPVADADYTLYLYKDGEEIFCEPLDRETGYALEDWNEVKLPVPVTIEQNATYEYIIDCYDIADGEGALGIDDKLAFVGISDLYSTDDGASFLSMAQNGGSNHNWMMDLQVSSPDSQPIDVVGYDVLIDNVKDNAEPLSETAYTKTFPQAGTYQLAVRTLYDEAHTAQSRSLWFSLKATGIDRLDTQTFRLDRSADGAYLRVEGGVSQLDLYDASGRKAASAAADVLRLTHLPEGVYVLRVRTADGVKSVKINLTK